MIDEVTRATSDIKTPDALAAVGDARRAYVDGRYKAALRVARKAKELSPRSHTVREILGLAAYRAGDWDTALSELRAYRRMSGDTNHLPVEIDVLRALDRKPALDNAWTELQRRGARPVIMKEGTVVYASHLIDIGDYTGALSLTEPRSLRPDATEADHRLWYVAARAAALLGDLAKARKLRDAIITADPAFAGIEELDRLIANR